MHLIVRYNWDIEKNMRRIPEIYLSRAINIGFAAVTAIGVTVTGCSAVPLEEPPKIVAVPKASFSQRPDCVVVDINDELTELAAGELTYNPRQIPTIATPKETDVITQIRADEFRSLQQAAQVIKTFEDTGYRRTRLSDFYHRLEDKVNEEADRLNSSGQEVAVLLRDDGRCFGTKKLSLLPRDLIKEQTSK